MERSSIKRFRRGPMLARTVFSRKSINGFLMAAPYILFFALFGLFNLVAGTVLTIKACKPKFTGTTQDLWEVMLQDYNKKNNYFLEPVKVVGGILLLTGILLILLGCILGFVACMSVHVHRRRTSVGSFSGIQMSSINGPNSCAALSTPAHHHIRTMSVEKKAHPPVTRTLRTHKVVIDVHATDIIECASNSDSVDSKKLPEETEKEDETLNEIDAEDREKS